MSTNTHIFATKITDNETQQTKTVEELFMANQGSGYESVGSFTDETLQVGVSDVPKTVLFGTGGTTSDGGISVGSNGELSILKEKYYSIKQRFRAGRAGAAGISDLFFWAEASMDGGNNWIVLGNSVDISLDSSNDITVFFDLSYIKLPVGVLIRNRFARSSTGDNSGDLRFTAPSATLGALGVPIAPSAQITIYTNS